MGQLLKKYTFERNGYRGTAEESAELAARAISGEGVDSNVLMTLTTYLGILAKDEHGVRRPTRLAHVYMNLYAQNATDAWRWLITRALWRHVVPNGTSSEVNGVARSQNVSFQFFRIIIRLLMFLDTCPGDERFLYYEELCDLFNEDDNWSLDAFELFVLLREMRKQEQTPLDSRGTLLKDLEPAYSISRDNLNGMFQKAYAQTGLFEYKKIGRRIIGIGLSQSLDDVLRSRLQFIRDHPLTYEDGQSWGEYLDLQETDMPLEVTTQNLSGDISADDTKSNTTSQDMNNDSTHHIVTFNDEPLSAISNPILDSRIRQIRQHVLIPKEILLRIYHSLVLGQNIILSGPPGTGKTELARLVPRILWLEQEELSEPIVTIDTEQTDLSVSDNESSGAPLPASSSTPLSSPVSTGYTVTVATATDEWTPRQLIGGIVPSVGADKEISYDIEYGYLAKTIMANWSLDPDAPTSWQARKRHYVQKSENGAIVQYRGCWLVIDEFNRAPIDLALGEALTALSGGITTLTVPIAQGTVELPIPQDFRIIGTLNTFDRHFLNQMSEALKRRFTFIEILPPSRRERSDEQAVVLRRVLQRLQPLSKGHISDDGLTWNGVLTIANGSIVPWEHVWQDDTAIAELFNEGWRLFESIRIYRQFGTAQAISWVTTFLGTGLLQDFNADNGDWRTCLDIAFADTMADQLQILFPDELEALVAYLSTTNGTSFAQEYRQNFENLLSPKRRAAQLMALSSIHDEQGSPYFSRSDVADILQNNESVLPETKLIGVFQAGQDRNSLPRFAERLERILFERQV